MLRCRRTDTEKEMEPRLLAVLSHVFDHFGEQRIEVVSGFRNQRKTTSYHYKGTAADIRIEGVPARKLKAFVETLDAGGMGIGIYPRHRLRPHRRPPAAQLPLGRLRPLQPGRRPEEAAPLVQEEAAAELGAGG